MTIFFTTSYRGKAHYQTQIDLVRETLETFTGIDLISPESGNYQQILDPSALNLPDKLRHQAAIRQGIRVAQAVIFEVSHESFQIGYETALALHQKKPVLCLSSHEDFSTRTQDPFFFGAKYNAQTIKPIIQDFLANTREMVLSKRFNLFLYPQQEQHLKQAGEQKGMNKSEYIRYLINQDKLTS